MGNQGALSYASNSPLLTGQTTSPHLTLQEPNIIHHVPALWLGVGSFSKSREFYIAR